MSVKPSELENRAETGAPRGTEAVQADIAKVRANVKDELRDRLEALESHHAKLLQRIASARDLKVPSGVIDDRSWYMGKDAALHAIGGP